MKDIEMTHYNSLIFQIKQQFKNTQIKASVAVNSSLLEFYWYLGSEIVKRQKEFAWGSDFLTKLSDDLSDEFSDIKGFSKSNLQYIRRWYLFYDEVKVEQLVPLLVKIPWGHNIVIISKCKNRDEALFYINKTMENGYSRAVLVHQIESDLYHRLGKAISNFDAKLPALQSDLAKETLKDPYCFDFLKPLGVSEYQLGDTLPKNFKSSLPQIKEIEEELQKLEGDSYE